MFALGFHLSTKSRHLEYNLRLSAPRSDQKQGQISADEGLRM